LPFSVKANGEIRIQPVSMMKRTKLTLPALDPMLRDVALIITASLLMSIVFFTTGYMVFVQLMGQ